MVDVQHNALAGTSLHRPFNYEQDADPGAVGAGKYWLDTNSVPRKLWRRNTGDTDWDLVAVGGLQVQEEDASPLDSATTLIKVPNNGLVDNGVGDVSFVWNRIYSSASASPPANPNTGDIWLPTDSFYEFRYNGSIWVPYGPLYPLTEPNDAVFSWQNQGTCTISTANRRILLSAPVQAGNPNIHLRMETAPATPWTRTIAFLGTWFGAANAGLVFRESSTSKLHVFRLNTATTLGSHKYTNPTTFSATYVADTAVATMRGPVFLQVSDDGTNRICRFSSDGQNWTVFHTVTRLDFLTGGANEVGFFLDSGASSAVANMNVLHYA